MSPSRSLSSLHSWIGPWIGCALPILVLLQFLGCATTSERDADLNAPRIDYDEQVRPIFETYCYECHGPIQVPSGKFRLDTREGALEGGRSGRPAIIPGSAAESPLMITITGGDGERWQPMPRRGRSLGSDEIATIRRWINQGAPFEAN